MFLSTTPYGRTNQDIRHSNQEVHGGRWRVDGPLLTLEQNGKWSVQVVFALPHWYDDPKAEPELL